MEIFGRNWSRRELEARVGRIEQVAGLRRFRLVEGQEDGTELIQVRTGSGLNYYVNTSRAMDISLADYGGVPISWAGPGGDIHPGYFEPSGSGWLRTAAGGLLMTCGLTYVGAPGEDEGQSYGLHGRIHHLPARHVTLRGEWQDDDYEMVLSGIVEEGAIFGENIRLTRVIRSRLGENSINIEDSVENLGFQPAPHMILYHFNFGFPLMTEDTTITFPSKEVVPREPETPLNGYDRWQKPEPDSIERVYYHSDFSNDPVSVVIQNPNFPGSAGQKSVPIAVRLSWLTSQLPRLVQWKMPGEGVHVLGIEPANCHVEGRAVERRRGTLEFLEPAGVRTYQLKLEVRVDA